MCHSMAKVKSRDEQNEKKVIWLKKFAWGYQKLISTAGAKKTNACHTQMVEFVTSIVIAYSRGSLRTADNLQLPFYNMKKIYAKV